MAGILLGVVCFLVALGIYAFVVEISGAFLAWLEILHFVPRAIVMIMVAYLLWASLVWMVRRQRGPVHRMARAVLGVGQFLALFLLLHLLFLGGTDFVQWLGTLQFIPRSGG